MLDRLNCSRSRVRLCEILATVIPQDEHISSCGAETSCVTSYGATGAYRRRNHLRRALGLEEGDRNISVHRLNASESGWFETLL